MSKTKRLEQALSFRSHFKKRESGFTLIELVVVVTLISIMLVMAVPSMRETLLTDSLNSTAAKLIGTVKSSRNSAVREQQSYLLHFDNGERRIWSEKEKATDLAEDDKHAASSELALPPTVTIQDIWTKSAGLAEGELVTLWISKQGYMDETFIHLSEEERVVTLYFSPFLATVKVFDDYIDPESYSQ